MFQTSSYSNVKWSILSMLSSVPSPWRNQSARSAVNRKVGGSSLPGDV